MISLQMTPQLQSQMFFMTTQSKFEADLNCADDKPGKKKNKPALNQTQYFPLSSGLLHGGDGTVPVGDSPNGQHLSITVRLCTRVSEGPPQQCKPAQAEE